MGTHFGWGRGGLTLCLACLLLLGAAGSALAHRVNIFAWLEGESVRGECTFHRGAPVRNGTYRVFDQETGRELLRGQTDDEGRFAFTVPAALRQEHGLRIRIQAGDGHQNEWVIEAAEFPSQLTAEKEESVVRFVEACAASDGCGGVLACVPPAGERRGLVALAVSSPVKSVEVPRELMDFICAEGLKMYIHKSCGLSEAALDGYVADDRILFDDSLVRLHAAQIDEALASEYDKLFPPKEAVGGTETQKKFETMVKRVRPYRA